MDTKAGPDQLSMFFAAEPPASPTALLDSEREFMIRAVRCSESFSKWLRDMAPVGLFGRTSPEFVRATTGEPLEPCSGVWANSGMGTRGQALMLSTEAWRNGASVCSLSDILETGDQLQPYFLTQRACAGILRRAAKRGRELPPQLLASLMAVAQTDRAGRRTTRKRSSPDASPPADAAPTKASAEP